MKHFRFLALPLCVLLLLSTVSCNTIQRTNISYLGADDPGPNVIGRGTHRSWAGIGVTGSSYAQVYEDARSEAEDAAEKRLDSGKPPVLYNIKVFRENRMWPQAVAASLFAAGFIAILAGVSSSGDDDHDEGEYIYDQQPGNRYYQEEEEDDGSGEGLIILGSLCYLASAALFPLQVYDMWLISDYAPEEEAQEQQ